MRCVFQIFLSVLKKNLINIQRTQNQFSFIPARTIWRFLHLNANEWRNQMSLGFRKDTGIKFNRMARSGLGPQPSSRQRYKFKKSWQSLIQFSLSVAKQKSQQGERNSIPFELEKITVQPQKGENMQFNCSKDWIRIILNESKHFDVRRNIKFGRI